MITLLVVLTMIWILALTWAVLEVYSIVTGWLSEKLHGGGRTANAE